MEMNNIDLVAKVWADTLAVQNVAPYDNFFDLGGDSLLITIMAFKLEQKLDMIINVDLVFDHPTLEEFCAALFLSQSKKS